MPLFVPVLRSAMLLVNIYDSYKTLKPPPPSARDPTRPSVRAATQRKRDLKGCLAIWIVWCCFTIYERLIEQFVNLFIPFYDEFKSMVILFLIITRARGAEPIFLHVLRPLIRPHDASIDGTLEVLRMTGDFLFALASFPILLGIKWWKRRFSPNFEAPDSDTDSSSEDSSSQVAGSDASVVGQAVDGAPRKKPSSHRQQSGDTITGSQGSGSKLQAQQHQIWHPSRAAYEDDDGLTRTASSSSASTDVVELTKHEREVEEWRKYPAFPSAYPPTPMTTASFLPPSAASKFAPIAEEPSQQDFHRSLKQPRKPLNPGLYDLSDQSDAPPVGIHPSVGYSGTSITAVDMEDDSMSDASYDEEDSFNVTLRTPLPPHGSSRSRMLPPAIPISAFPSQSTAVNSAGTASSLQTDNASGLSPGAMSPTASLSGDSSSPMEIDLEKTILPQPRTLGKQPLTASNQTRPPATYQRRTRPRTSPVKKRKVSRSQDDAGTSTSGTTDEDGKTAGATQDDASEEVYVPSGQPQAPVPKKPRVVGTIARKGVSASKANAVDARGARTAPPPPRSQPLQSQRTGNRAREMPLNRQPSRLASSKSVGATGQGTGVAGGASTRSSSRLANSETKPKPGNNNKKTDAREPFRPTAQASVSSSSSASSS